MFINWFKNSDVKNVVCSPNSRAKYHINLTHNFFSTTALKFRVSVKTQNHSIFFLIFVRAPSGISYVLLENGTNQPTSRYFFWICLNLENPFPLWDCTVYLLFLVRATGINSAITSSEDEFRKNVFQCQNFMLSKNCRNYPLRWVSSQRFDFFYAY